MIKRIYIYFLPVLFLISCQTGKKEGSNKTMVAEKPPMGWNSFDAWDYRINEKQFMATVDVMSERLLQHGWEYAVLDYIWWFWEPANGEKPPRFNDPNLVYASPGMPVHQGYITIDSFGRFQPSPERFPSSAGGKGLKPLADYVHSKGLKFGLHIMRGIPRYAVAMDTPVKGTKYSARDIADVSDTCSWLNHTYGIDPKKPGAQEYYNSLFDMYASWGVDFIKVDDILSPVFHEGEIKLIRNAIDNCGRPMVLSLSPGEAPLDKGDFLVKNANMWRIADDFWDDWKAVLHNFDLLNKWAPYTGDGHWPDADMLPLGHISLNGLPHGPDRMTNLTRDEQITLMTLWSVAGSPLMIGADLLSSPDSTFLLLTNDEVLYVDQNSKDNHQVESKDGKQGFVIWMAKDKKSDDRFLAMFNLSSKTNSVCFDPAKENLQGPFKVRDLWKHKFIVTAEREICAKIPPHGAVLYRLIREGERRKVKVKSGKWKV